MISLQSYGLVSNNMEIKACFTTLTMRKLGAGNQKFLQAKLQQNKVIYSGVLTIKLLEARELQFFYIRSSQ